AVAGRSRFVCEVTGPCASTTRPGRSAMTRKIRGAMIIALSAGLVLATAACSSEEPGTDAGPTSSSETSAADTGSADGESTSEEPADTSSADAGGEPVTLTLWTNATTGPGTEFFQNTIKAFEAENPSVTIEMQIVQNEDLDGKLQTALQGGEGSAPDIFLQRGGGKLSDMVKANQLMDISDAITDDTKAVVGAGAFAAEQ